MTVLISNSVRHDTQNFALLSANFGPAYVEENSYSFFIHDEMFERILFSNMYNHLISNNLFTKN